MKVVDYLKVNTINLDLEARDKKSVIKELFEGIENCEEVIDKKQAYQDLLDREALGSTGIGKGVAIPHAKTGGVDKLIMTIGISKKPIPFESLDGEDVRIFFMFLAPLELSQEYLILLAKISRFIKEDNFRNQLLSATTNEEIEEILNSKDR